MNTRIRHIKTGREGFIWSLAPENFDPTMDYIVKFPVEGWSPKIEIIKGNQLEVLPSKVLPPFEETEFFRRRNNKTT